MKYVIALTLFLMILCNHNSYAEPLIEKPIELSKLNDIQDAKAFGETLEVLNGKIRNCVAQGIAKPRECDCLYPKEFLAAKAAFDKTLALHPSWQNQAIVIRDNAVAGRVYHWSFRALNGAFGGRSSPCPI